MFSVEFTFGRHSVSARLQDEASGQLEFCYDVELRSPPSAGFSGAEPTQRDRDAQIRRFFFSRLFGNRWCRG
jgi:hypothetical protein